MFQKWMFFLSLCLLILSVDSVFGQVQGNSPASLEPNSSSLWVMATAGKEQIRFTSLGMVHRMRLEVLNQVGDEVYDSGFREGSLLDWTMADREGHLLPDGLYGCLVTVEDFSGRHSYRQGVFSLRRGVALFGDVERSRAEGVSRTDGQDTVTVLRGAEAMSMTHLAHDGKMGRIVSGRGGLSFRVGDMFTAKDVEHMRLTAEGNLGLGVEEPEAKLDVAGLIRTSKGVMFPDGTIQRTAANPVFVSTGIATDLTALGPGGVLRQSTRGISSGGSSKDQRLEVMRGTIGRVNATEGATNTFYGTGAGTSTTGKNNSFFGVNAGFSNTTGGLHSFFGVNAGFSNTTGGSNSFFGVNAGFSNTTGENNSFFGATAGSSNTTESNNSFIGAGSTGTAGITNATAIGYLAKVTRSNSLVLGGVNGVNGATAETNVGIGTTNPDRQLVVEGTQALARFTRFITGSGFGPALLFERAGFATSIPSDITAGDYLGKVQVRGRVGGNMLEYGAFAFVASDTSQNGRFGFFDRDIATERVSILNTGNVGIGTTNPDRLLVLEGAQALARFTRFNETGSSFGPAYLCERARGTQAAPLDILAGDHLGKVQFRGRVSGNMLEYGAFSFVASDTSQNGRFAFFDRDIATERVSILNTGNVGIGTTAPTERLHVVGNLKVSGTILTGAPETEIPDYVFEPDYNLMQIEELEKFIAREKHLPNIPKASEIKEKGLNLSEFQMKLLEKIEELTLYTVHQAETIRELQTRLVALEKRR